MMLKIFYIFLLYKFLQIYCFRYCLICFHCFQYYYSMILIFLTLVVGIVLAFVFRDKVKEEVSTILQDNLITTYQDDPDKQSTIDWIQENVSISMSIC